MTDARTFGWLITNRAIGFVNAEQKVRIATQEAIL